MFFLEFHSPLGVDSTDVRFSLTVPRGKRQCKLFSKGFILYLASVSVDTPSKITITNGACSRVVSVSVVVSIPQVINDINVT